MIAALAIFAGARSADAQRRLPPVTATAPLPEPVYWKQEMFLVPYQFSSAAEAGAAQAVRLFVSKDRGASWQMISEARPNVTSFNYRAEGDGEYWFAIRTIDRLGRAWPDAPYQPELRVIVDTVMPQLTHLSAQQLENGAIAIAWSGSDANLDPASLKIEAEMEGAGAWQPVPPENLNAVGPAASQTAAADGVTGQVLWTPPPGVRPAGIRGTIFDRAGNPATFQTSIAPSAGMGFAAATQVPPIFSSAPSPAAKASPPAGWVSSAAAATSAPALPPAAQPWPGTAAQRPPFRLFSEGQSLPEDGVTAYGNPPEITTQIGWLGQSLRRPSSTNSWGIEDSAPATHENTDANGATTNGSSRDDYRIATRPARDVAPLQPFRQASVHQGPPPSTIAPPADSAPTSHSYAPQHTPTAQPKLVGSRTFALEYDLDDAGRWGVTKVELWGTRDGGQTWHRFARDDDHRSPLTATVDEEGLYGFRIVVESAGAVAQPPSAGDEPQLWVEVDLHRPVVELTAIERGIGNLSDHLILRWRAADDNLEPRPISLFYSSRPAGPWSAIGTHLQDTGEYAWRVERHVPERFYLRIEARDTAGNLAAFQTREPIEFSPHAPGGRLLDAESMDPTAHGIDPSYR